MSGGFFAAEIETLSSGYSILQLRTGGYTVQEARDSQEKPKLRPSVDRRILNYLWAAGCRAMLREETLRPTAQANLASL